MQLFCQQNETFAFENFSKVLPPWFQAIYKANLTEVKMKLSLVLWSVPWLYMKSMEVNHVESR